MSTPVSFRRTRLAPTPSGYLHLGNIASFALTLGLARRYGAKVLLRIDDLDSDRARDEYINDIFESLHFLGMPWDEGPRDSNDFKKHFSQSNRLGLYQRYLHELRQRDLLFACTCTRSMMGRAVVAEGYPGTCLHKNILLDEAGVMWRIREFPIDPVNLNTLDSGPQLFRYPPSMHYLQVRKKDTTPVYQLASVADDVFYDVDLIVRGADLMDSSLAQLYLAEKIGADAFGRTSFFHHPLLTEADGGKMSKSAGAYSVNRIRTDGGTPADVFGLIARELSLDTSPSNWEELFAGMSRSWIP